ncbi:glycosyl transferase, group 1 family protein [Flammeovirgaceae bacterium 311]|nr:glycosyl transferase, group 1 family protein [Flammeovirgaceae bacterium 311]
MLIRIYQKIRSLIAKNEINLVLTNVFNTSFNRKVLISYLTNPFTRGISKYHTNLLECYTAAEIFKELGYDVDVMDFRSTLQPDYSTYAAIYGFGNPLENYFYTSVFPSIKTFTYGTGCYPVYSDAVSIERVRELYRKKGRLLVNSARVAEHSRIWHYYMSDVLIVLGNSFTVNTYQPLQHPNLHHLNAFYHSINNIEPIQKDFAAAKKNYLWFGSQGAVHKGLDLLLEVFSAREDISLHICGLGRSEGLAELYSNELSLENIHDHGWVDLDSQEFINLMMKCGFCIFPSISEGGAPAVLTVVGNGGLIPVISKAAGLDLVEWGYIMEEVNAAAIAKALDDTQAFPIEKIAALSDKAHKHVKEEYTHTNYKKKLKTIISKNLI